MSRLEDERLRPRPSGFPVFRLWLKFILAFAGILAAMGIVWGGLLLRNYFEEDRQARIAEEIRDVAPSFEVTSVVLANEYQANDESAGAKYKEKVILVSGIIDRRLMSFTPPSITLLTSDRTVRCYMPESEAAAIEELPRFPDQRVQMKGKVGGVDKFTLALRIDGCTLQQVLPL